MLSEKNDNPRLLLAKLRKADYTHAGDEEAIDIFLEKISKLLAFDSDHVPSNADIASTISNRKVLDVGCGLGGTADYVRKKTSLTIYGIDIDAVAINHARRHYPAVNFFECDVMKADKIFDKGNFDLIYLFNVFYAVTEQKKSLEKLAAIAKPGAILAIFDYTQNKPNSIGLKDLAGKVMNPIYLEDASKSLKVAGWDLIDIVDLSEQYDKWYAELLEKLKSQEANLLNEFTNRAYHKVLSTFSFLSNKIKSKEMGGSIIYAKHREAFKVDLR
jgi:SAM-dependent methyltransferase